MKKQIILIISILIFGCSQKKSDSLANEYLTLKYDITTRCKDSISALPFFGVLYKLKLVDSSVYFNGDTVIKKRYAIYVPFEGRVRGWFAQGNTVITEEFIKGRMAYSSMCNWSKSDAEFIRYMKTEDYKHDTTFIHDTIYIGDAASKIK
jgi:hypothetical protein